jgi:putative zinc finger protein
MPEHTNLEMGCSEFDALLMDALDGVLSGAALDRFQAHARSCKACGPLFAEVEAGRGWLKGLAEVEPPASLVANILASTTGVDSQRLVVPVRTPQPRVSWLEHWQASFLEPVFASIWATVRQPRFAMSFGMAFFALSVGLTASGVKPHDAMEFVKGLQPSEIRHTYYNTQARVVRYYDNARIVYEYQAAMRRIKRNVAPAEPGPGKQKENKNDTTQQPEQKQDRDYSQTGNQLILASDPLGPSVNDLPVVSVTTYRRFV